MMVLEGREDGKGGGGALEQNMLERGGSEGCFVFTSWPVVAFD